MKFELCLIFLTSAIGLEAPQFNNIKAIEPLALHVMWKPAPSYPNEVMGYKVKVWTVKENISRNFKLLNGKGYPGLEKDDKAAEEYNPGRTPKSTIREITLEGHHWQTTIKDIELEVLYEMRVQAYNKDREGPLSNPVRIKIVKLDNTTGVITRYVDACVFAIHYQSKASEIDGRAEMYPSIYTLYF